MDIGNRLGDILDIRFGDNVKNNLWLQYFGARFLLKKDDIGFLTDKFVAIDSLPIKFLLNKKP